MAPRKQWKIEILIEPVTYRGQRETIPVRCQFHETVGDKGVFGYLEVDSHVYGLMGRYDTGRINVEFGHGKCRETAGAIRERGANYSEKHQKREKRHHRTVDAWRVSHNVNFLTHKQLKRIPPTTVREADVSRCRRRPSSVL